MSQRVSHLASRVGRKRTQRRRFPFGAQEAIEGVTMSTRDDSGTKAGVKGVVEDVKGKAKEAVGVVTGRDDLEREGEAQQEKAEAQRDAAKKEAEAEAKRGEAEAHEAAQRVNER
jgi:uncharacterized protein YjbJ (UPF0337 family)